MSVQVALNKQTSRAATLQLSNATTVGTWVTTRTPVHRHRVLQNQNRTHLRELTSPKISRRRLRTTAIRINKLLVWHRFSHPIAK